MTGIRIRELTAADAAQAAAVLGRGMRDNPLHVTAFGPDPNRRERALTGMFTAVLRVQTRRGTVVGAFSASGAWLGVSGMVPPGRCALGLGEKIAVLPALVLSGGAASALRVLRWSGMWSRRDPSVPHWHLGPVAVERHLQSQGIGSALLNDFCRRVDAARSTAYLETDKRQNVGFYERFGFRVVDEIDVLDVPNWFMLRDPAG